MQDEEGARLENYLPWVLRLLLMSSCINQVFDTGTSVQESYWLVSPVGFDNSVLVSDSNCHSICFFLKNFICWFCLSSSEETFFSPDPELAALSRGHLTSGWNLNLILYSFWDIIHWTGEYLKRDLMNCDRIIQETAI